MSISGNHRRALAIFVIVGSWALAFSCGFPEVQFGPDSNTSEGGVDREDPSNPDGSSADVTTSDAYVPPGDDAQVVDRGDAAKLDPNDDCVTANPCDCDNDGYESVACDGGDCNDRDGLVHPNQDFVIEPPTPPNDGNWDCVAPVEKQYGENLDCAGFLSLGLGCPTTTFGFTTTVGCGVQAPYYQCSPGGLGLGCGEAEAGTRRQGCR